jgi:flagellar protein FlaG
MSRIDAFAATQVADVARPVQTEHDRALQAEAARSQSLSSDPVGTTVRADDLRAAAAQLKQVVETTSNRRLAFEVHDESGEVLVQVRDVANGNILRQIPSEELLRLHERLSELVGVLFSKDA